MQWIVRGFEGDEDRIIRVTADTKTAAESLAKRKHPRMVVERVEAVAGGSADAQETADASALVAEVRALRADLAKRREAPSPHEWYGIGFRLGCGAFVLAVAPLVVSEVLRFALDVWRQ